MKQKTTRNSTRPALPNSTPVILSIGHKCSTISHIGRGREPNHRGPRSQIECDLFVIGGRLRICSRLHGYRSSQCDQGISREDNKRGATWEDKRVATWEDKRGATREDTREGHGRQLGGHSSDKTLAGRGILA